MVTGAKSRWASYGSLAYRCGLIENVASVVNNTVWPSAPDLATASVATMVFAPGRFSTNTGCPHVGVSFSASCRPRTSIPPPGGYATTMRTGLLGQPWAAAASGSRAATTWRKSNFMSGRELTRFACRCLRLDNPRMRIALALLIAALPVTAAAQWSFDAEVARTYDDNL